MADRTLREASGNEFLRGRSFRWSYDGIVNRLTSAAGGDTNGQNLRVSSYTPNALNQYAAIQNPGAADVIGAADDQAAVTINNSAASRQGDWFYGEVTADNSAGPVWKATTVSDGTDTTTGSLLIPPASQSPQYDADGNLTSDGVHGFTWDGENRLIKIETLPAAVTTGVPYQRVEMAYDSQWRRIRREQFDNASSGTPTESTRYLWAGWRCLADLGATEDLEKCYIWGLDQAHQLHLGDSNNALLWTYDLARNERHFCHYDGNGNVTGLSDASGNHTAEYFYNAFGEVTGKSGSYADENDYRFSTKPFEEVGGLYYYGYRYLDSAAGRWLSRDPLAEQAAFNLHAFISNSTVSNIDLLGLARVDLTVNIIHTNDAKILDSLTGLKAVRRRFQYFYDALIPGAQSIGSLSELSNLVSSRARPYSKSGEDPCNCIERLTIWTHGSKGVISFGNDDLLDTNILQLGEQAAREPKLASFFSKQLIMFQQLSRIRDSMCSGATLEIRACDVSKDGSIGPALASFMGNGVKVVLYSYMVAPSMNGDLIKYRPEIPADAY